ncbi:MAG: Phosphomannomutase/phosphoglucomutase [candidate division WS2 bacterium ADurb.Bin280]|uniref:Phosphomannomutase/phosphoglucomutase n=1 Tax=candidate division WS2 bacterium ADurb.Bin280 TaxID=1852829 RepID=A0A1V5SF46_9BACT|nr:MAG: Phosphomannomutase/phosphoglucomutase [candidate division WS2 bacterium ADurb.Bin280]
MDEKIFRAYDVRGTYPDQMNEETAYKIACAYVETVKPKTVVVGRDLREASEKMFDAVVKALTDRGVNVKDAGRMTNPMIGFAVFNYGFDGGIILSASHNPIGYGGMKMTKKDAVTVPGDDSGLKNFAINGVPQYQGQKGKIEKIDIKKDYIDFVRSMIDIKSLKQKKILFDAMYGSVGLILDDVLEGLPVERVNLHTKPDKNFGGLSEPNPLNTQIQQEALELAKREKPDFTVMWDGDGDRVFFLDEKGCFINAPYITAALVEVVAKKYPGSTIVCDERIIWPVERACEKTGTRQVLSKSGYRFMKETFMKEDGVFGAETTAHYFFKETKYMDNGVIPFLMIWQLLSETGKTLSEAVAPYRDGHFMIDEIKFKVEDQSEIIVDLKKKYSDGRQNEMDGLTVQYDDWRFNFRGSNTEPAAKLNLEAKDEKLMQEKVKEVKKIIEKNQ